MNQMDKAIKDGTAVFVFGSNLAGIHGAGAAKHAQLHWGAVYGQGVGHHGMSYAIPTKDHEIRTMPLNKIWSYILTFIRYARANPSMTFKVTQIGCGLAGYRPKQIAPMFVTAPSNCWFDTAWKDYLASDTNFWGHM